MENGGQRMNCYCWQTGENWVAVINPWYNESLNQDSQAAFIQTYGYISYIYQENTEGTRVIVGSINMNMLFI